MYFSSSCGSDSSEHGGGGAQKRRRCEEEGAGGGEVGPDSVHGDDADGLLPDACMDHAEARSHASLLSKWRKRRFSLFSRFDEGILLDKESFFSVTPEAIALYHSKKLLSRLAPKAVTIVDAFSGCGGNAIAFARCGAHVIAVEIDAVKVENARHNANVYGVGDKIEWVIGDFFDVAKGLRADAVFASPPWGGPKYRQTRKVNVLSGMPVSLPLLYTSCRGIADRIGMFLPRNIERGGTIALAGLNGDVELETTVLDTRTAGITAWYNLGGSRHN